MQKAAAEAFAYLSGVTQARSNVVSLETSVGFNNLTLPQKHYLAVDLYNGEVNNGGHAQYFVNSSGKHWKMAIEGLNAIGAVERATILHAATSLFGNDGPSEDDELRHQQIAKFGSSKMKKLRELDRRYFASHETVDSMLPQYALKHKQDFSNIKS